MSLIAWIAIAVVVALAGWALFAYNGLVRRRQQVREAWSDIDVQLKRRHNLIPNVVETVKGYAAHEAGTFDKVTKARAAAVSAKNPAEQAQAENMLTSTLKTLFAVSEAYPELKANANFLDLQRELADTENKIQASRRFYNSNVRDLNTAIETVPTNIIANMFKFTKEQFFEIDDEQVRSVPKVTFRSDANDAN